MSAEFIPDDIGPAMMALDERQRRWVRYRIWDGMNPTQAAKRAGYSASTHLALRVQGHRLGCQPRVIAALREESDRLLGNAAPLAISRLVRQLDSKNEKICAAAIDSVLDRTGYARRIQQDIRVEHRGGPKRTYEQILEAVASRLAAIGGVAALDTKLIDITPVDVSRETIGESDVEQVVDVVPSADERR